MRRKSFAYGTDGRPARQEAVLEHLPAQKGNRVVGLSIGYRIPGRIMELATNDADRAALKLLSAPATVGRPFFTTPSATIVNNYFLLNI